MSLLILYNFEELPGNKGLSLINKTGMYSAANPGGFDSTGINNPRTSDVTTAVLDMIFPDGHNSPTVDLMGILNAGPVTDNSTAYLLNTLFGLSATDPFPDGHYTIIVTYTGTTNGAAFTSTRRFEVWFDGQAKCCTDKLGTKVKPSGDNCGCSDNSQQVFISAKAKLCAAANAFYCGDFSGAEALLAEVNKLCLDNKCNC